MSAPDNNFFGTAPTANSQMSAANSTICRQGGQSTDANMDEITLPFRRLFQASVVDEKDHEMVLDSGNIIGASAQNSQASVIKNNDIEMGDGTGASSALAPLSSSQRATLKRRETRRRAAERRRANMMAIDQPERPTRASTTSPPSLKLSAGNFGLSPAGPSRTPGILRRQLEASTISKASNFKKALPKTPSKAQGWSTMSASGRKTPRRKIQRRKHMEAKRQGKLPETEEQYQIRREDEARELHKLKMHQLPEILEGLGQDEHEKMIGHLEKLFRGDEMVTHPFRASGMIADPNDYRTEWLKNMMSFGPQELTALIKKGKEWRYLQDRKRIYERELEIEGRLSKAELKQAPDTWKAFMMDVPNLQEDNLKAMDALGKEMLDMVERSPEQQFQWLDPTSETPKYAILADFHPSANQMTFKSLESDHGLVFKSESSNTQSSPWTFGVGGGGESSKATAAQEQDLELENIRRRMEQMNVDCELMEDWTWGYGRVDRAEL